MKKNSLTLTVVANMTSNYSESLETLQVFRKYLRTEKSIL